MNSLFFPLLHYEFSGFFANSLFFREFTSFLGKLLWIYLVICDSLWIFEKSPWIPYLFCELKMNSLSFPLLHFEFTVLEFCDSLWILAKSLWIHYLSRGFTTKSRIHHLLRELTTMVCLYREFSTNLRDVTRIHYELFIFRI